MHYCILLCFVHLFIILYIIFFILEKKALFGHVSLECSARLRSYLSHFSESSLSVKLIRVKTKTQTMYWSPR